MKFKKQKYIMGLLLFAFFVVNAQEKGVEEFKEKYKDFYVLTKPNQEIALDTLELFRRPKFKTSYSKRYYFWLKKKTYKAYPYAVLAKEKNELLNDTLAKITSKRKRKKYIRKKQKIFEIEFSKSIKKLTKTEGRILIKMIHRLTGLTVNKHIQDKRGKLKAFWYRFSASLFKINLKDEYHPESIMEDYVIESILREAFLYEKLKEEISVLDYVNNLRFDKAIEVQKKK